MQWLRRWTGAGTSPQAGRAVLLNHAAHGRKRGGGASVRSHRGCLLLNFDELEWNDHKTLQESPNTASETNTCQMGPRLCVRAELQRIHRGPVGTEHDEVVGSHRQRARADALEHGPRCSYCGPEKRGGRAAWGGASGLQLSFNDVEW